MEPVKRAHHNFTYTGPSEDIGDLSGHKAEGQFQSHWRPNSDELAKLLEGGDIELTIVGEPIPPVNVGVLASDDPTPSDPSMEVVEIVSRQWRVPPAVKQEIEDLRAGMGDKLMTFEPAPNHTIIVTVPDTASPEMMQAILGATAQQFPEHRVAVLPESLGLHAKENFTEMIETGSEMARLILHPEEAEDGDLSARGKAAEEWEKLINGG